MSIYLLFVLLHKSEVEDQNTLYIYEYIVHLYIYMYIYLYICIYTCVYTYIYHILTQTAGNVARTLKIRNVVKCS
jgi:hypothetical protein